MRIGVDATCWWNRRGYGRFTVHLLNALLESTPRHEYVLVVDRVPEDSDLPQQCEVLNARPRRTVTESAVAGDRRSLGDLWTFSRAVRKLAVDLFFYPAVYSYFPQPPGRRSVICFHDVIAETYPRLVFPNRRSEWAWDLKSRLAMWQSTRVMTVSEASRQGLVEHFKVSPDRVDVVTEGTDPRFRVLERATVEECLRRLRIPRDAPYLLYVGGISPHKNLATLLHAMPAVLQGAAVNLVLAGDLQAGGFLANSRELQQVIEADAGLRHRCRFTGFISDEDLVALYNGAYALVFPSLLEGFGLPALESMASGTPVIASRAGALPEVVGDSGLLFDPRDAGEMAAQILRLVEDPGLRATLAGRARERAKQFTWRRAAELALECFERAVA